MNFSNIKLVVSDMDGTLLNSEGQVSNRFFKLFQKLQENNIHFCAASGRQHNSIVSKLASIKNDIYVIAENGGVLKKGDEMLRSYFLNPEKVQKLIPILRGISGANMVLCCDNTAFIESKDERFITLFQEYYHSFQKVADLTEIAKNIPVFKIAIYHFDSSEKYILPIVQDFKNEVLLKVSGAHWLDVSDEKANKGNALKAVQKLLNVTKQETLVFGDYHNDIEMMQEAGMSFAMKNAHEDIKKIADYITESNDDFGVEMVLEKLAK
ncbi:MAG: HAD family hydrolase [Flavobacteriia bacterium]|nr:HAD family hydrolase [Flavobacteriia bacterium]OIP47061.1 MAG: haloacid dehalogenase [Flavobacteriaceae bacterium CG2_30_31_66]PIV97792.1 MAG: Cof-type HAD-IIB family hydrolase [Flavobacteriaceae bacterium CG17_big_fil_post_rev_8_21_14_2_50_31_13]PIX12798.1 MAG: Cof-type HAD-IIB family hydrolase [Flavobacteriaceae bacterium CG_4_8_14_3_um_filter_31_8]PIY14529.1 MAG: Cof-type HAD-IIB family hydrolase [Flavobacteriaceae bacterium CG_4_10_14_3_um_filter_31_253]PIZ11903.1 MAG: Cof-type HAD-IIB 